MSCIIRVLSLLGDKGRVQQRLSAVLRIDVLAGNATLLLCRGAGLVNAADVGTLNECHVREWTNRQQGRGLQAAGP